MKKLLLLAVAASLSFAAFAAPSVDPTPGMATILFSVPEVECTYPDLTFCGDVQGYDPASTDLPVATLVEAGWYKLVLPLTEGGTTQGKICPRPVEPGVWNYQGKTYVLAESSPEWASIVDDYGTQNKIVLGEGCMGAVVTLSVEEWASDFCKLPNPAGTATFTMTCEIPETADPTEATVYIEGQGSGQSWGQLGELLYDDRSSAFSGTCEVPAVCEYKYVISYKGGSKIYMSGDNLAMPYNLVADDEVTEWDSDPWVDPIPAGEGTFSVTFTGECQPSTDANDSVFIAGNFEDTPDWERVYYMEQGEGESANKWTVTDLAYPEGFMFKFVVKYDLGGEEYEEKWVPADNITFDGETYDFEFEGPCKEVAAEEVAADAKANTYKFIENGMVFINANGNIYNMQGILVK